LFARPDEALGGIGQTPPKPVVRIDYIQHTASAMARGLDLIPERWNDGGSTAGRKAAHSRAY
jgi:hypothetical protein